MLRIKWHGSNFKKKKKNSKKDENVLLKKKKFLPWAMQYMMKKS